MNILGKLSIIVNGNEFYVNVKTHHESKASFEDLVFTSKNSQLYHISTTIIKSKTTISYGK